MIIDIGFIKHRILIITQAIAAYIQRNKQPYIHNVV
jgi:hypothetical protein